MHQATILSLFRAFLIFTLLLDIIISHGSLQLRSCPMVYHGKLSGIKAVVLAAFILRVFVV